MSCTAASRMNLAALQRVDSAVTEIVDNASQVALYKFSAATSGWEKTEIEGALFVFAWSKTPRHGFIVMNRLSTTNLLEVITPDFEFQVRSPYLLYKNSNSGIYCVWFYNTKECERIGSLCKSLTGDMSTKPKYRQRCASESDGHYRPAGAAPLTIGKNGASRDIVALLSKAKDQYDMKKAGASSNGNSGSHKGTQAAANHGAGNNGGRSRVRRAPPTSSSPGRSHAHNGHAGGGESSTPATVHSGGANVLFKPMPVRGTDAPQLAKPSTESPSTPLTVAKLFAAVSGGCADVPAQLPPKEAERNGSNRTSVATAAPGRGQEMLRELLSNPANLLEHVERMQLNEGGRRGDCTPPSEVSPRHRAASCLANLSTWESRDAGDTANLPAVVTPAMLEQGALRPNNRTSPAGDGGAHGEGVPSFQAPQASDLPLLSPMAFTRPARQVSLDGGASSLPASNSFPCHLGTPPYMNGHVSGVVALPHASTGGRPHNSASTVSPLTKEQLRDALVFMLETDNDFLVKLHEAYVGSIKSRFGMDGNGSVGLTGRL